MDESLLTSALSQDFFNELFPRERADQFFEALYGGAEEGAFDIALGLEGFDEETNTLILEFRLTERPGKCMACSLTYGLPPVFERHPVIDLNGIIEAVEKRLPQGMKVSEWSIGPTLPKAAKLNVIPLRLTLTQGKG